MKRSIFYSFHYELDSWRASQVRNIGVVDGNQPAIDNDWETVPKGSEEAIKNWISEQMHGRSCTVVLVGEGTANRKWINYEIEKSWNDRKGVVGIRIHGLKDNKQEISEEGDDPFDFTYDNSGEKLSRVVKLYNPSGQTSKDRYSWIEDNLANAIEEAIEIRNNINRDSEQHLGYMRTPSRSSIYHSPGRVAGLEPPLQLAPV